MLDGFDEINSGCQNKVVQLVKHLNESIPLYITTRPHMADQLQFELSQLVYSLNKFTEDDQINYLSSIWKAHFLKEKTLFEKVTIRSFATKLIEQISKTLNDKEKEFIGIPLQCRILAECFQSKIISMKKLDDFSYLLEGKQFDLANLYKLLMEEKRRVFREEKIKFNSGDNHIVIKSIEKSIRKTEVHLRKLAIQTIVDEQKYIDILIPSTNFESEEEQKLKEEHLNESGIRFGLLDEKSDGSRMQFLHRTYAEYLMVDFIYNGFLLEEKRHNRLLENESIMHWIIEKLFVEDKYNGIRVFFDSMLKDIINEEWKNRIKQRNLPYRFQRFASFLCHQGKEEKLALHVAFEGRNANILLFILDCLDVKLHETPSDSRSVILKVIETPFNQRTDVFQRILNYFNDADECQLEKIVEKLCLNIFWDRSNAFEVKQENIKLNVKHLLDFMNNCREKVKIVFKQLLLSNFRHSMPIFFVHHGTDDLIKKYFNIMTFIYSDDFDFTNFIKEIVIEYSVQRKDWNICRIEKTLIILRDIGRINVLPSLSRFVLVRNSEVLQQDENLNIRLWLEETGMTGLHGATFRGDLNSIEKNIGASLENPDLETISEEVKKSVLQRMVNEKDIVSPFHVAAAYGHEEICRKIIVFLPDSNGERKYLNKFSIDAIKNYQNVKMVKTILSSVKQVWGQNALIQLLQPVFRHSLISMKEIAEKVFSVVVENVRNGYRDLNDLIFKNDSFLMLKHIPCGILQGMIAEAGGLDEWIKRLIDTDIYCAFEVLSSDGFLDKLDQEHHIPKLIDIIIILRPSLNKEGTMSSYWSEYVKYELFLEEFIEVIAKRFSEDDLKRLLFARDENNIVIIYRFLIWEGPDCFKRSLSVLPEILIKELKDSWKEETPQLIDHFFSSGTFSTTFYGLELLNAIEFYLVNGNEKQLSKCSQVVDVHQLEKSLQYTSGYQNGKKFMEVVQLLKGKLDSKTVVIYNSLFEKYLQ